MKCFECGARMTSTRGPHRYTECGLPNVTLADVEVRRCTECGEWEVVLPALQQLHEALAHALVKKSQRLTADEVRFLRKRLGWSATMCARRLGVSKETVSRWENGKTPIGATADRLLRTLVMVSGPIDDYSHDLLETIASEPPQSLTVQLQMRKGTWSRSAA